MQSKSRWNIYGSEHLFDEHNFFETSELIPLLMLLFIDWIVMRRRVEALGFIFYSIVIVTIIYWVKKVLGGHWKWQWRSYTPYHFL